MPWTKIRDGECALPRDVQRISKLNKAVEWWKVWVSWMGDEDDMESMLIEICCVSIQ